MLRDIVGDHHSGNDCAGGTLRQGLDILQFVVAGAGVTLGVFPAFLGLGIPLFELAGIRLLRLGRAWRAVFRRTAPGFFEFTLGIPDGIGPGGAGARVGTTGRCSVAEGRLMLWPLISSSWPIAVLE